MPHLQIGDVSLHYEETGSGYPLLLLAPGSMRSTIDAWDHGAFNPIAEFAGDFRVIAMDQRNAGESRAPITAADGWPDYTNDQLALLDHLGIEHCHIMGGCIGSSFCLGLVQAAPGRITAAVLQNPIGLSDSNRPGFFDNFDEWGAEQLANRPDVTAAALAGFRGNLYDGDFVFAVSREFVRSCPVPLFILPGNDAFHPTATAREIEALAPNAELLMPWGTPAVVGETVRRLRAFLQQHEPAPAGRT